MEEKLTQLYSTLTLIETKGESSKVMADCLRFLEQVIKELKEAEVEKESK